MSFQLTAEQRLLAETVRGFLERWSSESAVRAAMESDLGYDHEAWALMASKIGLQGVGIPEKFGGAGYTIVEVGVIASELGRFLACVPYFPSCVLSASTLLECGDSVMAERYLPRIASGEVICSLAVTEGATQLNVPPNRTSAVRKESGEWKISGTKTQVINGTSADILIVSAMTGPGPSLFVVDTRSEGVSRIPLPTMDLTRKLARVEFTGVTAKLLADAGDAMATLRRVSRIGSAVLACEQAGGAERAFEMALEYAKGRYQFGRSIASYQAIKHRCADMLLDVEEAKSASRHATRCIRDKSPKAAYAAHVAKAYCSDIYMNVAAENIQLHGGIGFTWEYPAQLYYKRAKSSQLLLGAPAHHMAELADYIGL